MSKNYKIWDIQIKKLSKVKHLGFMLGETLSGEAIVFFNINKISNKLELIHRKNRFLTPYLRHLLCDLLIQLHFGYSQKTGK